MGSVAVSLVVDVHGYRSAADKGCADPVSAVTAESAAAVAIIESATAVAVVPAAATVATVEAAVIEPVAATAPVHRRGGVRSEHREDCRCRRCFDCPGGCAFRKHVLHGERDEKNREREANNESRLHLSSSTWGRSCEGSLTKKAAIPLSFAERFFKKIRNPWKRLRLLVNGEAERRLLGTLPCLPTSGREAPRSVLGVCVPEECLRRSEFA